MVQQNTRLLQLALDGDDIYWLEQRPQEKGRYVIVRRTPDGAVVDVNPAPFNARTRVHEYGGASFIVDGGVVYFSNFEDQRLYRQEPGSSPEPLTPPAPGVTPTQCSITGAGGWSACAKTTPLAPKEASNAIVSVSLVTGEVRPCWPRATISTRRRALARTGPPGLADLEPPQHALGWLRAVGRRAEMRRALVAAPRLVAGGRDESIFQPEWSPEGVLHFVSDRSGWWNLYRWRAGQVEALRPMEAEFGEPQWVFRCLHLRVCGRAHRLQIPPGRAGQLALLDTDPGWRWSRLTCLTLTAIV